MYAEGISPTVLYPISFPTIHNKFFVFGIKPRNVYPAAKHISFVSVKAAICAHDESAVIFNIEFLNIYMKFPQKNHFYVFLKEDLGREISHLIHVFSNNYNTFLPPFLIKCKLYASVC